MREVSLAAIQKKNIRKMRPDKFSLCLLEIQKQNYKILFFLNVNDYKLESFVKL